MLRKLALSILFAACALITSTAFAQEASDAQAFLRVLQVANDNTAVSLMLQDGNTVLTNFLPGSVSDYFLYDVDRSTRITLTISVPGGFSFAQDWVVPPLAPGHHTLAVVGSGLTNTLELVYIDEGRLCEGRLETGSCVILVNNINNAPPLTLNANSTPIVQDARPRQAVVGQVAAASYFNFAAVESNNPQAVIFRLQLQYFEPNVIYIYSLRGNYPARRPSDYVIGTVRRVPVDTMAFLRGLTANLQLSDGNTLFSAENIVAVLEQSGYAPLVANSQLPLTVFAPLDEAIIQGNFELYQCALDNSDALRALILNHIIVGDFNTQQLVRAGTLSTLASTTHTFRPTSGGFMIDNTLSVPDSRGYQTANGYVYLIDDLLVPPGFEDEYCTQG
jgi:uncharacterized surface protein with fasciclin (FAS1) repeats